MTSIKIIREREAESFNNVEQHKLLSAAYSLLQQNFDKIGYRISEFTKEELYSKLKARSAGNPEGMPEIFIYTFSGGLSVQDLNASISADLKDAPNSGKKPLSVVIGNEFEGSGTPSSDIILGLSRDGTDISLYSGSVVDSPLDSVFREGHANILGNYPHPYNTNLDPLIKFRFLSLNHSRNGKYSLVSILHETSDQAYALTVNQDREIIRADLQELLTDMDRAGIITARGNEIYFPKNSEKLEKSIIRRYWDYVEKIGKRTLFDFEAPF